MRKYWSVHIGGDQKWSQSPCHIPPHSCQSSTSISYSFLLHSRQSHHPSILSSNPVILSINLSPTSSNHPILFISTKHAIVIHPIPLRFATNHILLDPPQSPFPPILSSQIFHQSYSTLSSLLCECVSRGRAVYLPGSRGCVQELGRSKRLPWSYDLSSSSTLEIFNIYTVLSRPVSLH